MAQLEQAILKVESGQFSSAMLPDGGSDEIGRLMSLFKQMAGTVLESRNDLERKVRERTEALERLAHIDPMTELLNRRGMAERLEAALARKRRDDHRFGLLLLDVDYFKSINDSHGHGVGDRALVLMAELLRALIRPYDSAARWGGDEFLVLVMDCDEAILTALGERICAAIAKCDGLKDHAGKLVNFSVSIGGVLVDGEDVQAMVFKADQALYAAKTAGRGCVRLFKQGGGVASGQQ
jgi:diguanylate cyclase (GGDEF)-like protein